MSIDELEQQVLGQARASFERNDEDANSALSMMQRRLAAAPFVGLAGLELPPIPDVSGAFVAAQNAAVVQGAATSMHSVSTVAQVATFSKGSAVATAATTTGAKVSLLALATQLTPAKIILAAALVGGGAGVTYGVVTPSPAATPETPQAALGKTPSPPSAVAAQDPISQDTGARPPSLEEKAEGVSPEVELPAEMRLATAKKSPAGSSRASEASTRSGSALPPVTATSAVSSFNDEFTYLRKAQNALRSGDAHTAWQLMVNLDQESPAGALIPERRMTKVLALCALGKGEQAQSVARTVLNSSSGPMYRSRIEKSCAKVVALPPKTTSTGSSTASFPDRLK